MGRVRAGWAEAPGASDSKGGGFRRHDGAAFPGCCRRAAASCPPWFLASRHCPRVSRQQALLSRKQARSSKQADPSARRLAHVHTRAGSWQQVGASASACSETTQTRRVPPPSSGRPVRASACTRVHTCAGRHGRTHSVQHLGSQRPRPRPRVPATPERVASRNNLSGAHGNHDAAETRVPPPRFGRGAPSGGPGPAADRIPSLVIGRAVRVP